jgi:hypothetical protein
MSHHMRHRVNGTVRSAGNDGARMHPKPASLRPRPDRASWGYRLGYVLVGLASLAWLGVRSGLRPSRLAYPCQRVAATQGLGFVAYVASAIASTRVYHLLRRRQGLRRAFLAVAGLALLAPLPGGAMQPIRLSASLTLPAWTSPEAVSDVYAVTHVPLPTVSLDGGTIPEGSTPAEALHDRGVDALIDELAAQGRPFYRTPHQPQGLIGPDDVVVLKVNNQWNCGTGTDRGRSHTNIDVIKGVIYRIVQHPQGFSGAVVVADNTQFAPGQFDCADDNNAQDTRQSHQDVVDAFVSQGYPVCISPWEALRTTFVDEYDSGDVESGYVAVQEGTPGVDQLSYPKFEVACGPDTYRISMRYGLWDGSSYDGARLKMINMPIVKRHSMAGATLAVKNYIGFLTTGDTSRRFGSSTNMHNLFWGYSGDSDYGLLGRQLALIRRADLNIVDAIWVNPTSQTGGEEDAVRANVLLASVDPFALDYYGSVYVLLPYMAPGSSQAFHADARQQGGEFRGFLLTNENRARSLGMVDIVDLDDRLTVEEELAQFNVFVADASAPPRVTLALAAEPAARTIQAGQSAVYTVSAAIHGGYARPVGLALAGLPSGTTIGFNPNPVLPLDASRLTVSTTAATMTGTYPLALTGTADPVTATAELTLIIRPPDLEYPFKGYLPLMLKEVPG